MDFKELVAKIENFGVDTATYWSNALAGETGEVCNLVKKFVRDQKDITKELPYELADVFIYLYLTAQFFNIDLENAILEKLIIIEYRTGKKLCRKCQKNKILEPDLIFTNQAWRFLCQSCKFDSQWG